MELIPTALLENATSTSENIANSKRYRARLVCLFLFLIIGIMLLEITLNFLSKVEIETLDKFVKFFMNKSQSHENAFKKL